MNLIIYSVLALLQMNIVFSYICEKPLLTEVCPDASLIKYYLYTKNNVDYTEISVGQLDGVKINKGCPFVYVAHGFLDNSFLEWVKNMIQAFLQVGCFNIVAVDWSAVISMMNYSELVNLIYPYCAYRTCCSGENVGALIVDINKVLGANFSTMHFVGHSLGAHLGGCAGNYVISETGSSIGRITGMDPAGPMFDGQDVDCKLSSGDADFVDCIHSDMLLIGTKEEMGDVDFYPNGGAFQPCPITPDSPIPAQCSHIFAYKLMTESILTSGFISSLCDNYAAYEKGKCTNAATTEMGYSVSKDARGKYYLDTIGSSPFVMNGERRANNIPM